MFYKNLMVTTKHKSRAETTNIKKRKLRKTSQKTTAPNDRQKHKEKETGYIKQPQNKRKNGNTNFTSINNYCKGKWIEFTN